MDDRHALDVRATECAAQPSPDGDEVRYLGSILMRQDEVVLCFFEGPVSSVRRVAEAAKIPFERILEMAGGLAPGRRAKPRGPTRKGR